jgi:hypothetical protein
LKKKKNRSTEESYLIREEKKRKIGISLLIGLFVSLKIIGERQ